MATTNTTAVGVFTERAQAEDAIEELHSAGFTNGEVGFIAPHKHQGGGIFNNDVDATGTDTNDTSAAPGVGILPVAGLGGVGSGGALGAGAGAPIAPLIASQETYNDLEEEDDTAAGATTGAVGGGILGGILGAAAALLIPGFGPVIAGGILAATLGGAALGALAGGLVGALTHLGVPEDEARYYQDELNAGKTIVTVHTADRYEEAISILRSNGAADATGRFESENETAAYNNADSVEAPVYTKAEYVETTAQAPASEYVEPTTPAPALEYAGATTPYTAPEAQAAYDPTLVPSGTVSEVERHNQEVAAEESVNNAPLTPQVTSTADDTANRTGQ